MMIMGNIIHLIISWFPNELIEFSPYRNHSI